MGMGLRGGVGIVGGGGKKKKKKRKKLEGREEEKEKKEVYICFSHLIVDSPTS